jgi:hypothetical protein
MGTRVLKARQLSDVCQITDLSSLLAMLNVEIGNITLTKQISREPSN